MASRNLTAVEGLRFFLFLGIFVFHCVGNWFPIGWGGVEAFLVIGAFFLTRKQLKVEHTSIRIVDSFIRRIKRLYPIYLTLLILATLGFVYVTHSITAEPLWYLFSLQNFRCLFESASYSLDGFLGHFWYIGLDVWLFLIWVILMRFVPKCLLRRVFTLTLIIGLFWRTLFILFMPGNPSASYVIPFGQMDSWSIGGLVALNTGEREKNDKLMYGEMLAGTAGIILLIVLNAFLHQSTINEGYLSFQTAVGYMTHPLTGNIHLFIGIFSAGLLRYCIDSSRRHPVLSSSVLVALGGMTYELYCFHYPIQVVAKHFISNQLLMTITALIATCIVSTIWSKWSVPVVNRIMKNGTSNH